MTQAQVLLLIQQNIVQNNNEEITADVLRPILEEMLNQPNILIGDLDDLGTVDQTTIVAAINELLSEINSATGVVIHYGTGTPTDTPPASFDITDYYVQQSGATVLGMWQWNGNEWVKIEDITDDLVLTTVQFLTEAQKEQARINIGVGAAADARIIPTTERLIYHTDPVNDGAGLTSGDYVEGFVTKLDGTTWIMKGIYVSGDPALFESYNPIDPKQLS